VTVLDQPRVPAGEEGGGRFATKACPQVYALLDTLAPQEPEREGVSGRYYRVEAPRCPHGHFARWAVHHCKRCR
jgi:hypothetical protein